MDKDFYISLIQKELTGNLSGDERRQLEEWKNDLSENKHLYDNISEAWKLAPEFGQDIKVDVEGDLKIRGNIDIQSQSSSSSVFIGTDAGIMSRPPSWFSQRR